MIIEDVFVSSSSSFTSRAQESFTASSTSQRCCIRCRRYFDNPRYSGLYRRTLSVGLINFKRIREGANVPIGYDIFPYIRSHYQGEDYAKAMKVVEEEELKAQQNVKLQKSDEY